MAPRLRPPRQRCRRVQRPLQVLLTLLGNQFDETPVKQIAGSSGHSSAEDARAAALPWSMSHALEQDGRVFREGMHGWRVWWRSRESPAAFPARRKLALKLAQRIGLALLPPRAAAWRYERRAPNLQETLAGTRDDGKSPSVTLSSIRVTWRSAVLLATSKPARGDAADHPISRKCHTSPGMGS